MKGLQFPLPFGKYLIFIKLCKGFTLLNSQLEAIIRISEALAKLTLCPLVQEAHVDEAIRLFKFSTMDAVQAGNVEGMTRGELMEEVEKIERDIRRRLPIGWSTSYASLVREFVQQQGYTQHGEKVVPVSTDLSTYKVRS